IDDDSDEEEEEEEEDDEDEDEREEDRIEEDEDEEDEVVREIRRDGQPEPRPKSRHDSIANTTVTTTTRYNNLGYWRARRVTFYKNGDPYFPGVEFRFKPGRDIGSLEALLDRLSLRLDLPRGARHIFSMDGDRKLNLDELEDGASYVVSSYKTFKVKLSS
ncbi:GSCOCG00007452001-RA-CDS, partial [Cotesia congregata]